MISRPRLTLTDLFELHFRSQNLELGEGSAQQYRTTLRKLVGWRGGPVYVDELDRELVLGFLRSLIDKGQARGTVNSKRAHLMALWRYAKDENFTHEEPGKVQRMKAAKQSPQAWESSEVDRLVATCEGIAGEMRNGVSRRMFFACLVYVCWFTGLRIKSVLALKWDWLREDGGLDVPFEAIKERSDRSEKLPLWLIADLKKIRIDERLLPWDYSRSSLWKQWKARVVKPAGVPAPVRKGGFHRFRKTFISYVERAQPGLAAAWMHADAKVTREHYIDPKIAYGGVHPSELLPPIRRMGDNQQRRLFD
jgi:integrase